MLLLSPHLTTTSLKAYLQQFRLPSTTCLVIKKKLQGIPKGKKKTQLEETKQASEPDMAAVLELSSS